VVISASIVVYSQKQLTDDSAKYQCFVDCVKHLLSHELITKIIIIDNSPSPYLLAAIPSGKKLNYIYNQGNNLGFGRGHNLARVLSSDSEYHIFINPDIVFLEDDCISILLRYMVENKDVCIVQPKIVYPNSGKIQFLCKRNPTLMVQVIRSLGLQNLHTLRDYNSWYEMRDIAYRSTPVETQYLSGCFMFCRKSSLEYVNWFDPRYFMYLEDADLTRSAAAIGKCIHLPHVTIGHLWARGSHKLLRLRIEAIKSYVKYSLKWGFRFF